MAYNLTYFFDMRSQTAEQLLDALLASLRDAGNSNPNLKRVARGTDWPQALDWISGSLIIDGSNTGLAIEVHTDVESVEPLWSDLAGGSETPPMRPAPTLATCTLTLVGDLDEAALNAVRSWLLEDRRAVEHDGYDGFTGP